MSENKLAKLPPKKNYSNYVPSVLKEAYVQAMDDPDKMDLSDEMMLMRAMLKAYLQQITEGEIDLDTIKGVTTLVDKIGKIHAAISTHESKMREHISVKMIPFLIRGICGIVKSEVEDEQIAMRIGERIANMPLVLERTVGSEVIDG